MTTLLIVKAFSWPQPNLGQVYIGSAARRAGHDVRILDTTFWKSPGRSRKSPLDLEEERNCGSDSADESLLDRICSHVAHHDPDCVGLAMTSFNRQGQLRLAEAIKRTSPRVKILVGGIEPTLSPETVISHRCVDAVCIGEGEESIPEYLSSLETGKATEVGGVWTKEGTHVHKAPLRPFIEDLDRLPFPDWQGWPIEQYSREHHLPGSLPLLASRGCPYRCSFCTAPVLGKRIPGAYFRLRSPRNVVEEIRTLVPRYPAADLKSVTFLDETFGLNRTHFEQLMQAYREEDLHEEFPWDCQTRPDLITREWAREARRGGCIVVRIGVDHGLESIRNSWYKRGISDEQIRSAVRNLKEEGILVVANVILGGPFETRKSLQENLGFTLSLGTEFISPSVLFPLPGTEIRRFIHPPKSESPPRVAASDALSEAELMNEFFRFCRALTRRQCVLAVQRLGVRLPRAILTSAGTILGLRGRRSSYRNPRNTTLFGFIIEDAMRGYLSGITADGRANQSVRQAASPSQSR